MAAQLGAFVGALLIGARVARDISRRKKQDDIMDELRAALEVPLEQALRVRDAMIEQMEIGLAENSSKQGLLMLPSYIDILPTGDEQGNFFAIDLGGTNLRVAYVKLGTEKGSTEATAMREWPIPQECFDVDNGRLLDWVAECTIEVLREHHRAGDAEEPASPPMIGFCFSFAFDQTAINNGKLLRWTKNFRGRALLGEDVVAALKASFDKKGVRVQIPAILNDTVSTLIALRYSEPDTALGIILGTGTNCALLERIDRITKLPAGYRGRSAEMIVNSEWGDFKGPCLPTLLEDTWVDCSSVNPGFGLFEKMISGLYLGEVARRLLLRLAEQGHLFGSRVPQGVTMHGSLTSPMLAAIAEDSSPDLAATGEVLAKAFGLGKATLDQRRKAHEVCTLVTRRSARLCAAAIAAMLRHMGRGCVDAGRPAQHTVVAVDGSIFKKFSKHRELLREGLEELCGKDSADLVELKLQEDGSVFGGAYIAAAAASWAASTQ